jgi:hypothetical protein
MNTQLQSDEIIELMIEATLGEGADSRQKFLYRETLRSLVRLAKSEQVVEIKSSVKKLTGELELTGARRRTKAVLLSQRLPRILDQAQRQSELK